MARQTKADKKRVKRRREGKMLLLAEEQVVLSKERTILSFMRTALTLIGVGLVVVNVFKTLESQIIGFALIFIGFVEMLESLRHMRSKQKMVSRFEKRTNV